MFLQSCHIATYFFPFFYDLPLFFIQAEQSFMTFEGAQLQGSVKIGEKLSVSFFFSLFLSLSLFVLLFVSNEFQFSFIFSSYLQLM